MARQTVKTTTRKGRRKKSSGTTSGGYVQCNMCHGTGRVKKRAKGGRR